MDERKGVKVARDRGLYVTGILGLLELAAQHGLINLAEAFARLKVQFQKSPRVVTSHAGPQCQTRRIVVAELRELWAQPKHGSSSAQFKQPSL